MNQIDTDVSKKRVCAYLADEKKKKNKNVIRFCVDQADEKLEKKKKLAWAWHTHKWKRKKKIKNILRGLN